MVALGSNLSKTKKTTLIFVINILSTLVTSIGSLFVTQKILLNLGSDYNGVNATASQIVSILALIEGGFTLASQVALYKPVAQGDQDAISKLISYTSKKMRTLGSLTLVAGILVSAVYAVFVKTELSYVSVVCIMLIAVATTAISVGVVSKYRLMFQVTQTEYICGYIGIGVNILQYISVFFALDHTDNVVVIRLIYFAGELLRGVLIAILAKRYFGFVDYHANTASVHISGTREVFISKITSMIYNSVPVLFISTFVGTASTSVYSVYLSVTNVISSLLKRVVNAPTHGLGQLIADSTEEETHKHLISVYREYELTVAFLNALICSIMYVMITPFISLYTADVSDASYMDDFYSVVMVLIVMIQILHMPSGICMSVSGRFKAVKNVQLLATVSLIVTMGTGVFLYGLKGLLLGKLFTAILLCVCEISYTYRKVIRCKLKIFFEIAFATYLPAVVVCAVEAFLIASFITVQAWLDWILLGFAVTLINTAILIAINSIANRDLLKKMFARAKSILKPH